MKKKNVLNLLLFGVLMFFAYTSITYAETTCVLGTETTKDVSGALKIFRIVAPLILLAYTILDVINTVNSGGSFHFTEGGDMTGQKVVSRFVKRLIGVLLLFILPTLINLLFFWAGIWDENGGCDFDGNGGTKESSNNPEAYGCYEYKICDSGCGTDYRWGKAKDNVGNTKVNNDKCGYDKHGSQYQCYRCNSSGALKWKATSDADSDCASGYAAVGGTQESCSGNGSNSASA